MGRPPKDPSLRMDTDLRIPVTAEQKKFIMDAVAREPDGFAAWARGVLLQAAKERNGKRPKARAGGQGVEP